MPELSAGFLMLGEFSLSPEEDSNDEDMFIGSLVSEDNGDFSSSTGFVSDI